MPRGASFACATLFTLMAAGAVHAATQVEVLGTYPAGDSVTLGRNQNFYLHLHYTSDVPIHIWVQPMFEGRPAKAGRNPSRAYPAGSGEALGRFFLFDPGAQVDEVRINAGDGSYHRTHVIATYPVSIIGGNEPVQASSSPAWVTTLTAAADAASRADYEKSMNAPRSTTSALFFMGIGVAMMLIGLAGLLVPAWGLWRWRGSWRLIAAVPGAIVAFVMLRILIDTARDPTSHNLWPFEIVMWGGFSCLWMLISGLVHKLVGPKRA